MSFSLPAAQTEKTSLGRRLARIRKAAAIGSAELAERAGAYRSHVSLIEVGMIKMPRAELLNRIAQCLGTTSDWLITGQGTAPTSEQSRAAFDAARRVRRRSRKTAA